MTALEKRALRFQNKNDSDSKRDKELLKEAFTCIASGSGCCDSNNKINFNNDAQEIQQLLQDKAEFLEVIGDTPGSKSDGITRIAYENVNGLPAKLHANPKLEKLHQVVDIGEMSQYQ